MGKWGKVFKKTIGILAISSLVISGGCGSSKSTNYMSETTTESTGTTYDATSEVGYGATKIMSEEQNSKDTSSAAGANPSVNTASTYNRKVIKTGNMEVQTEAFGQTVDDLTNCVMSFGGYIENSSIQGSSFYNKESNNRTATLTVRIPQKQFDAFINRGSEFGYVSYLACNSEDITSAYVDTEIRLKTLKTRYERLLALLEKSGSLSELFDIEQEIGEVTYEIERLSGTLSQYDALVDMGTITIQVQEVKKVEVKEPTGEGLWAEMTESFKASITALLEIGAGIIIWLTGVLPFAVILIPVGIVVFSFLKRYIKKHTREVEKNDDQDES